MSKRRSHSSIDNLPARLQETLTLMLTDNVWPDDFKGVHADGNPRYEDLVSYCKQKGFIVTLSAIGRFGKRMLLLSRMKQAGVITRQVMAGLGGEKASQTQKAVAEMITAITIDFIAGNESFSAKQIKDVATAMRECTSIAIKADSYLREQIQEKAKAADKKITQLAGKKKLDAETLKIIREQVYGIVK